MTMREFVCDRIITVCDSQVIHSLLSGYVEEAADAHSRRHPVEPTEHSALDNTSQGMILTKDVLKEYLKEYLREYLRGIKDDDEDVLNTSSSSLVHL
jgi:hypothetical protein